jgi:hypothetical protein
MWVNHCKHTEITDKNNVYNFTNKHVNIQKQTKDDFQDRLFSLAGEKPGGGAGRHGAGT